MSKTQLWFSIIMTISIMFGAGQGIAQKWPGIRDSIYSNVLKETRAIQVVIPKGYESQKNAKYEVLYVLDGEWYMEQIPFIYNFAFNAKFVPENIFVLIPNKYLDGVNLRDRDFSPTKIDDDSISGGADNFHAFLKNELIPYVEKKYPTNGQRSLVGSSFSGLFSVYAFVKEPALFQSYIASDPNLNWDNNYVSHLAAKRLPSFEEVESTLFFAGLEKSSKAMGSKFMDSVLIANAPVGLRWKFIEYANETHYSVQHKAFYDGIRFSHEGYSQTPLEFHPMNGIVESGKKLKLFIPNENPRARFTTDGTEPTPSSALLKNGSVTIVGSSILKVKSFPNRKTETQEARGTYSTEGVVPSPLKSKKKNASLRYSFYDGAWNNFSDFKKTKPVESGQVQKDFSVNNFAAKNNAAFLIEGDVEIQEEGYYIFGTNAVDGSILHLGDHVILETKPNNQGIKSFAIPLKKGFYSFRLELLQKKGSPDTDYYIFRTTPGSDTWWETPFLTL
jgi:predicted alpha/beta superfamily hydrolase